MRFVLSSILALGVGMGGVASTFGDVGVQPVRVELTAHTGCPDADAFYTQVRERTDRVRQAATDEEARTYRVTIRRVGDESVGELTVVDASGSGSARTVRAENCAEVVAALAFIVALSADPNASFSPAQTGGPAAGANSVAGTQASEGAPVRAAPSSPSARRPAPPSPAPRRPTAPRPAPMRPSGREVGRWRIEVGIGLEARGMRAPDLVFATPLHVDLSYESASDASVLLPAFRLTVARASGGLLTTPVGFARFRWTTGSIDACPIRVPATGAVEVRPCGGVEAGTLEADGRGVEAAQSTVRGWLAVRALARVAFIIRESVVLEAYGGLSVALLRDDFVFEPETAIYRPPLMAPFGGLALGVRFP